MKLQRFLEAFLGFCARMALKREKPLIIAVAGSVGKSSTKTAIGVALGAHETGSRVSTSSKNFNNELGIPLTLFDREAPGRSSARWIQLLLKAGMVALGALKLSARTYVLEMGTDRPGDLAYLIKIAKPHISVLTAIGPEHTEFFGSVDGVAQEEGTIVRCLGIDDRAVVNADDPRVMTCASEFLGQVFPFGTNETATARIDDARMVIDHASPAASGLDVKITLSGTTRTFRLTGTIGRPQAYAAAAALATIHTLGGDMLLATRRLAEQYHGMPGRMRLMEGIKRTWLIDDSYNSSPLAAASAIRDLASFPLKGFARRIAALGDMLELGSLAAEAHREMGHGVAEAGIDVLVVCGTFAHIVRDGALHAGMTEKNIFVFPQSAEAGRYIQDFLSEGDVVLVKGSQGVRMERIARELMAHPDRAKDVLVRQSKEWFDR